MINRRKLLALSLAPAAIPLAKMLPEPKPDVGLPTLDRIAWYSVPDYHISTYHYSSNSWTPPRGVWQVMINTGPGAEDVTHAYISVNDETGLISLSTNTPIRIG